MRLAKTFGYMFSLCLFGASFWLFLNRQDALDWWRLKDYDPSPAIVRLATDSSFSDLGRKLFYVHDPELLDKPKFNGKCSFGEETIILGCYLTHTKIYVFDVEDERLDGVEEVTSAHEMLHAAYDRLSDEEKLEINSELENFYQTLSNPRITKTISSYEARDPSIVNNELHSILATEVRDLSPYLEDYYSQYFLNRSAVVDKAEAYEAEFTKRENQIKEYDNQLKNLNATIKTKEANIAQLNNALTSESNNLNALKSDPEAYNQAVPSYNAKVREYNQILNSLKANIAEYNKIVELRNAIAVEEQDLVEAIDSRAIEL